jgi:hypothetical protein
LDSAFRSDELQQGQAVMTPVIRALRRLAAVLGASRILMLEIFKPDTSLAARTGFSPGHFYASSRNRLRDRYGSTRLRLTFRQ